MFSLLDLVTVDIFSTLADLRSYLGLCSVGGSCTQAGLCSEGHNSRGDYIQGAYTGEFTVVLLWGEHTHSFAQFYIFLHELFKKYYCFGLHCGPQV